PRKERPFRPIPLLGNPHLQTVLASVFSGPPLSFRSHARFVSLPDGDRIVLHDSVTPRWRPGNPMVLMVHGLGGSHRSGYLQRIAEMLLPKGLRVVRIDLRGSGRGIK